MPPPLESTARKRRRFGYERRIVIMALLGATPALIGFYILLWLGDYSAKVRWTFGGLTAVWFLGCLFALRERVRFPLQSLANILGGLRDEDYSVRARGAGADDPLGEVMVEVNALGESLREQRLGAMEAFALVRTVMSELDVAVFTFDEDQRLRLINRSAERLMAQGQERLLGKTAAEVGLAEYLEGESSRTVNRSFPSGIGRWGIRRTSFREKGKAHQLLVITDLSRALRDEERQAWQRLLRVLGHELNNSLAPIKSISGSLEQLMKREPRAEDWEEDMLRGLEVITARADSLSRFMEAYTRIARLPAPTRAPLELESLIRRVAAVETRIKAQIQSGPAVKFLADSDQLEQALINLLRNATDAALETNGAVTIGWKRNGTWVEIAIEDEGPGLANTANLFVPFFTTKQGGTGIGLALCRQIAEAHGGAITLGNRPNHRGCRAVLTLPLE
ncbi:MAG TPA: ATP-binding protein [Verrucomicrobiae bacterium]|nr:ATP-binding protein [Verrucomicrobiae bacterium]